MSEAADDREDDLDIAHPRSTLALFGHAQAEAAFLDAYRSGRVPHAWLIGGPAGIGKATLAYRIARFVLAHPDPASSEVQSAETLAVDAGNRAARQIASQSHPDLLVLERTIGDTGKLRKFIEVDDVRRSVPFFGSTAGEGGWRVAIVDAVDELNASGENALLKVLEEPPLRSLLLLVSHFPGRVLPTIRSRCRRLMLRPLDSSDVAMAAAAVLGRKPNDSDVKAGAAMAEGSVSRALSLLDGDALKLRDRIIGLLDALPGTDPMALHALGDALGTDQRTLSAFVDTINVWLSARLKDNARDKPRLDRIAQAWEKVNRAAGDTETFNLERRPLVFNVFGILAETARG